MINDTTTAIISKNNGPNSKFSLLICFIIIFIPKFPPAKKTGVIYSNPTIYLFKKLPKGLGYFIITTC
jgi:hypothetical protein